LPERIRILSVSDPNPFKWFVNIISYRILFGYNRIVFFIGFNLHEFGGVVNNIIKLFIINMSNLQTLRVSSAARFFKV